MDFLKKIFNKKRRSKGKWPLKPPRHAKDKHFMMNEFEAFGIHQLLGVRADEQGHVVGFDMFSIVMMENGYGERYVNVLRNGILTLDTKPIRDSQDWKNFIQPWLEDKTDFLPMQNGIMNAELSLKIIEFSRNK